MKKIHLMIVSSILILPSLVNASGNWNLNEKVNSISASGSCSGKQVRIDLFYGTEKNPIYTSGAVCIEGKFQFSDDLLQWESLKDGEYKLALNGDLADAKKVSIDRPVVQTNAGIAEEPKQGKIDPGIEEESTFLDAFVALQRSIFEMRERLETTEYPEIVMISLGSMLDGMDMTIGKMTELIFASQEEGGIEDGSDPLEIVQSDPAQEIIEEENIQDDGTEDVDGGVAAAESEMPHSQVADDLIVEEEVKEDDVAENEDILLMDGGIEIDAGSGGIQQSH